MLTRVKITYSFQDYVTVRVGSKVLSRAFVSFANAVMNPNVANIIIALV